MNILFHICHPAHVHFFKHAIIQLKKSTNHKVFVVTRDKEITEYLLKMYNIEYESFTKQAKGMINIFFEMIKHEYKMYRFIKKNNIKLVIGIGGMFNVHAAKLASIESFVFTDTEHAKINNKFTFPFATKIFTPDCFLDDLGPKQVRYAGYHELAYLHPNRFTPNPEVLNEIGLKENEKFFVVRFVSWEASHDIGQKGLSIEDKGKLIETLKPHGKIIITSERELPAEFEEYRMKICPTKMHDLLYYATMYIGEGGTMASEAACLGTYSILVNPLIAGTFEELKNKYQLMIQENNIDKIINKVNDFFSNPSILDEYKINHQKFLNDKIDVTQWMLELIEKESTTNQQ